jgi:hypothetical protein
MEAIFVLSELGTPEAEGGLLGIARDGGMDSEARCAAVWGLGVAGSDRPDLVLEFIADEDDDVALHALAAINHLPDDLIAALRCIAQSLRVFRRASGASAAGARARRPPRRGSSRATALHR